MTTLLNQALRLTLLLTLLTGAIYPLAGTWLAQQLFPAQANGSLVMSHGKVIGSALIGQPFTRADYFWSRPSAVDFNANGSGGSNLGPLNPQLPQNLAARRQLVAQPGNSALIPVELLTTSASGLDPHLGPAALDYQVPRVAAARHLPTAQLRILIAQQTEPDPSGIFGRTVVNVLHLNQALDALTADSASPQDR